MKKSALSIFTLCIVSACAMTPLTPQENFEGVAQRHVIQTCYQRGWLSNPVAAASYLNTIQSNLASRGNPEQISVAERRIAAERVGPEHCRQADLLSIQHAQQQVQEVAQQESTARALSDLNQNTQNIQRNMSQYQPRTAQCQHYQWGNMTTCSSF